MVRKWARRVRDPAGARNRRKATEKIRKKRRNFASTTHDPSVLCEMNLYEVI